MSYMVGNNKRREHNQRYRKTNDLLIASIRKQTKKHRARITVNQVMKDVGMARSSFYNHYPNVNSAIEASDAALVAGLEKFLNFPPVIYKKPPRNINRYCFELTFLYMSRHKMIFCCVCDDINNQSLLFKMVETLYPKLHIVWPLGDGSAPAIGSERVDMFFRMVVEVVVRWGRETQCDFSRAAPYVNRLLAITMEAATRCR